MKNQLLYGLALTTMLLLSCKKTIEKKQESILVQAMINGQWKVTNFLVDNSDITSDFNAYKFQYFADKTVNALNNGIIEKTGNWDGDIASRTTWAHFSGSSYPLSLLNGSWLITNNTWTYVVATQTNGNETKTMRLEKQ